MGTRGPKSSASLEVAPAGGVEKVSRPDAPYDLNDEQSIEWWSITERLDASWFPRETHALLTQYCRHVVTARRVAQLIAACEGGPELDLDQYDKLLKMQDRESRALSSLATRMRISQQSLRSSKSRKPSQVSKPWLA